MGLHEDEPVLTAGEDLGDARAVAILIHGRGASAGSILSLARPTNGSLEGTPVFLGCADPDPHIPAQRVWDAAGELRRLGGEVTVRLYPGGEHAVNDDEIDVVAGLLGAIVPGSR